MSFFSCRGDNVIPGPIRGNPMQGLIERTCIETKKVMDACSRRIPLKDYAIKVEYSNSQYPFGPLTFIYAAMSGPAKITDQVIERLPDRPNFARVSLKIEIPVKVTYTDAHDVRGEGNCTLTLTNDVILFVPQPSMIPFGVEAFAAMSNTIGTWVSEGVFNITCCVTLITKVVAVVDILVPSYGFVYPPDGHEYVERICNQAFELPLFPSAT